MSGQTLLSVQSLCVRLKNGDAVLDNVSLEVRTGEVLCIVGGSGSGKTTLGLAMVGQLPSAMELVSGRMIFQERDITHLSPVERQKINGRHISMVFQDPLSAFDPVNRIGDQIRETKRVHRMAEEPGVEPLLRSVGISDPARVAASYPHELSGGLRQRAMIGLALCCDPQLMIADEPTSNLDVTVQARILKLFEDLKETRRLVTIFITHDLGIARRLGGQVIVMNKGKIVDRGHVSDVLSSSKEAYTRDLMEAEGL